MGRSVHKVIDGFKNMVTPGQLFRELGFKYRGPIDGHDLGLLIKTFNDLKSYHCPILLHVLTKKGKGLDLAQKDPLTYHDGFPSFSTEPVAKKYQDVFAEELILIANENKNVVAVTAAMATGTGISKFQETHPDKCFDVGIAEQHGVSFCAGMANEGKIPFMAIYSTFLQRAIDQIFQEWSLQANALHGVFCMDRAGLVGNDGATHGGVFDIAYLRAFPFLNLMAPKDGDELRKMLRFAAKRKGIYAIRYPRGEECFITLDKKQPIELGKSELLQFGEKVAILAYGAMVVESVGATQILEKQYGIKPTLVNMRFAKPIDSEMVKKIAANHEYIITVEDHQLINGFGTAVAENMIEQHLNTTNLYRFGIPDSYVPHADRSEQLSMVGLDASSIAQKIKSIIDSHIYA
jgi:1-deoxy-D-xylulose-5-phosphate synthase